MNLSDRGADFIKGFEKLALDPYPDAAGKWTVGYGHLITPDDGPLAPITREQADALFDRDAARFVTGVSGLVRAPIEQQQFDALVAFAFNLGANALAESTLLKCVNAAWHDKAVGEFLRWNKAGGVRLNGLLARRAAEALIYAYGDYGQ